MSDELTDKFYNSLCDAEIESVSNISTDSTYDDLEKRASIFKDDDLGKIYTATRKVYKVKFKNLDFTIVCLFQIRTETRSSGNYGEYETIITRQQVSIFKDTSYKPLFLSSYIFTEEKDYKLYDNIRKWIKSDEDRKRLLWKQHIEREMNYIMNKLSDKDS